MVKFKKGKYNLIYVACDRGNAIHLITSMNITQLYLIKKAFKCCKESQMVNNIFITDKRILVFTEEKVTKQIIYYN